MSKNVQHGETIGQKRQREIQAEWTQKMLEEKLTSHEAGAAEFSAILTDGYELGIMGISLDTPADVAEQKIAEYKAAHQTPTQAPPPVSRS